MEGKLVIFSAPSGSGKTTIVKQLLQRIPELEFSVSATSRSPRAGETDGKEYYFLNPEEFQKKISEDAFVEYEEVYPGLYYGTLYSELDRIWKKGCHVIFDVDVIGGMNLKDKFSERALSVFVKVPSISELEKRLRGRSTESEETLIERLTKAEKELSYANRFDREILNEDLDKAVAKAEQIVRDFLEIHPD